MLLSIYFNLGFYGRTYNVMHRIIINDGLILF